MRGVLILFAGLLAEVPAGAAVLVPPGGAATVSGGEVRIVSGPTGTVLLPADGRSAIRVIGPPPARGHHPRTGHRRRP